MTNYGLAEALVNFRGETQVFEEAYVIFNQVSSSEKQIEIGETPLGLAKQIIELASHHAPDDVEISGFVVASSLINVHIRFVLIPKGDNHSYITGAINPLAVPSDSEEFYLMNDKTRELLAYYKQRCPVIGGVVAIVKLNGKLDVVPIEPRN